MKNRPLVLGALAPLATLRNPKGHLHILVCLPLMPSSLRSLLRPMSQPGKLIQACSCVQAHPLLLCTGAAAAPPPTLSPQSSWLSIQSPGFRTLCFMSEGSKTLPNMAAMPYLTQPSQVDATAPATGPLQVVSMSS